MTIDEVEAGWRKAKNNLKFVGIQLRLPFARLYLHTGEHQTYTHACVRRTSGHTLYKRRLPLVGYSYLEMQMFLERRYISLIYRYETQGGCVTNAPSIALQLATEIMNPSNIHNYHQLITKQRHYEPM